MQLMLQGMHREGQNAGGKNLKARNKMYMGKAFTQVSWDVAGCADVLAVQKRQAGKEG